VSTPTLPPLTTRVWAGAALLDRHYPGWHAQVEPDRLDAADVGPCVLGRLFGGYEQGLAELTACRCDDMAAYHTSPVAWAVGYGFDLDVTESGSAFVELARAWRAELARLRPGRARQAGGGARR
jgi:hypothetical protein